MMTKRGFSIDVFVEQSDPYSEKTWIDRIGRFHRISPITLGFEYDDTYRNTESNYPISLSMTKSALSYQDEPNAPVVSNFLWGLLPDDANMLKAYAKALDASHADPLALLAAIGPDCPGALMFGQPDTEPAMTLIPHDELSELIRELRTYAARSVFGAEPGYFSLAGAQSKTALVYDKQKDQWFRPTGSHPSTHIFKPAMTEHADQALNEDFCLKLAKRAGLAAATSFVLQSGEECALVSERYDRMLIPGVQNGPSEHILRIHQEDMCQALGKHPDQKYERDGGPTVGDVLRLLADHSSEPEDIERFFKAVVFNYLICGSDAHAKNYSVLHGFDKECLLAPLYDMNSLYPYTNQRKSQKVAMSIGGKYVLYDIRPSHFKAEAAAVGVDSKTSGDWLEEIVIGLSEQARACRGDCDVESATLDQIVKGIEVQSKLTLSRM